MNRQEFIQKCALMGIGVGFLPSFLTSCEKENFEVNFSGKVLVIGAGSAGLMAGYTLNRYNIDFQILEASSVFGGRVKKLEGFADFPIDLGAEWIHDQPTVFRDMFEDNAPDDNIELVPYNPETMSRWDGTDLTPVNSASHFYSEFKFKRSTWYDFFGDFIVPNFSEKIVYNAPVTTIDYSGAKTIVTTSDGTTYDADRVIITVPIGVLQAGMITFTPELPTNKTSAINGMDFPPGMKAVFEFSERFYPDLTMVGGVHDSSAGASDTLYIDGAFKKDSNRNILAVFSVSDETSRFTDLPNDQAIFEALMAEFDQIWDGKATQYYVNHLIQNWSGEEYIRGSYSQGEGDIAAVRAPVDSKLYFAGEAVSEQAIATVHGAGMSGRDVAKTILQGN